MHHLGITRSAHHLNHLLQTPDTFVRTSLPGLTGGLAIVHTAPAAGAAFTQYTLELTPGGTFTAPTYAQRFVYVLEGTADLLQPGISPIALGPGGYAYLPPAEQHTLQATSAARLLVVEKTYTSTSLPSPSLLTGDEATLAPTPLGGDPDLLVRALLPDTPAFDFAINTMTYTPGASLPMVEVHVMEHGLLMLEGGGIYRLGDRWYPVSAGDFIYMAPFCPQWFGALGRHPAKYILYKDANRHPLS